MNRRGRLMLIRHGKTKGNLEKRYVGRTEESILQEEYPRIEQLRHREEMKEGAVTRLYVSPMIRCVETARILYPGMEQIIVPDLRECDFGDFEYGNYEELSFHPQYQQWIDSNGTLPFPNGEPIEAFKKRCQTAFLNTMNQWIEGNANAVYVIHGGTIMAILEAFAMPHKDYFQWQVENLGGYWGDAVLTEEGWQITGLHKL